MKLMLSLLVSTSLVANSGLPESECSAWRDRYTQSPRIEVNDFTSQRADAALQRLNTMMRKRSSDYSFDSTEFRRAVTLIKGYLLRKELLGARANREHDADEMLSFCTFWASVAYGPGDTQQSDD